MEWMAGIGDQDDLGVRARYYDQKWNLEAHQGLYYLDSDQSMGPQPYLLFAHPSLACLGDFPALGTHQIATLTAQPLLGYPIIVEDGSLESWRQVPQLEQTFVASVAMESGNNMVYLPYHWPIHPDESATYGLQARTGSDPYVLLDTDTAILHNRVTLGIVDSAAYSGLTIELRYYLNKSFSVAADDNTLATVQATIQYLTASQSTGIVLVMESLDPNYLWQYGRGIIQNGLFETDLTGWTTVSNGSGSIAVQTSYTYEGTQSVEVNGNTAAGDGLYTVCTLATGEWYTLTAWILPSLATTEVDVRYGARRYLFQPDPGRWNYLCLPFQSTGLTQEVGFYSYRAKDNFFLDKVSLATAYYSPLRAYQDIGFELDPCKVAVEPGYLTLEEISNPDPPQYLDLHVDPGVGIYGTSYHSMFGSETPEVSIQVQLRDATYNYVQGYSLATVTINGAPITQFYPTEPESDRLGILRYRWLPESYGAFLIMATAGTTASLDYTVQPLDTNHAYGRWCHWGWKVFLDAEPYGAPDRNTFLLTARVTDGSGYPVTDCTNTTLMSIQPWVSFEAQSGNFLHYSKQVVTDAEYGRAESWISNSLDITVTGLASVLYEVPPGNRSMIYALVRSQITDNPVELTWYSAPLLIGNI